MIIIKPNIPLSTEFYVVKLNNFAKVWELFGIRHRNSGPAVNTKNRIKTWWRHGRLIKSIPDADF